MPLARFSLTALAFAGLSAVAVVGFTLQSIAQSAETSEAEAPAEPGQQIFIMPRSGPFAPDTVAVPNARVIAAWARSGHSDATSESFTHWNEDGEIPPSCGTCHSGIGFRAFHGLDDGTPGPLTAPIPIGGVVDCDTCHNPSISRVTEVTLPSGIAHPVAAGDASCTTCHQGRAAGATVAKATGEKEPDTPDAELRFINPHYALAASSSLGGYGAGGYHYPGKDYSGRFLHAKPVATCVSCHDPHSLDVAEATCLTCHQSGDAEEIRIARQSYDGSGDTGKGIKADIAANAATLKQAIVDYAAKVAGKPMVYNGERYPYFFADANGDGVIDEAGGRAVAYDAFTPRLLKAIYNWKFVTADHGIHVHNPHYALELLYDSIEDLAGPLGMDFAGLGLLR